MIEELAYRWDQIRLLPQGLEYLFRLVADMGRGCLYLGIFDLCRHLTQLVKALLALIQNGALLRIGVIRWGWGFHRLRCRLAFSGAGACATGGDRGISAFLLTPGATKYQKKHQPHNGNKAQNYDANAPKKDLS